MPGEIIEHQAHAVGHAAVLLADRGVLLAGDMLSDVLIPLFDSRQDDQVGAYETALDRLDEAASHVDVVVPGHGAVAEGPEVAARLAADRAYIDALRRGEEPVDARLGRYGLALRPPPIEPGAGPRAVGPNVLPREDGGMPSGLNIATALAPQIGSRCEDHVPWAPHRHSSRPTRSRAPSARPRWRLQSPTGCATAGVEAVELPVADGGEGTLDALVDGLGGEYRTATVSDPLGRPLEARFGLLGDGRAVVEMAQASGLRLVAEHERDAWAASTRGTGELIAAAAAVGGSTVLVTVGGSATTDGGAGALEALTVGRGSRARGALRRPDALGACRARLRPAEGSRRGDGRSASNSACRSWPRTRPRDPRGEPMTGCAGGLSGGLWAFRGATLVPGAAFVLDALGFEARLARGGASSSRARERSTSRRSRGKAVGEVAGRCRRANVTCHAVVGRDQLDPAKSRALGLAGVREATTLEQLREVAVAMAAGG